MSRLWARLYWAWVSVEMWWCLDGQFSRPVRMLSPRRRRAHAWATAKCAEPGYTERALLRLGLELKGRAALAALRSPEGEAELLCRIFAPDPELEGGKE